MKVKTIFLALVVFCKIVDVNAQYQHNPNLNNPSIESITTSSYRMQYEDPKTGNIYPDSVLYLYWNEDLGQWDTTYMDIYTYSSTNKVLCRVFKELYNSTKYFRIRYIIKFEYNAAGNIMQEIYQYFAPDNTCYFYRTMWKYNQREQCTEVLDQSFIEDDWVNSGRTICEYDAFGNLIRKYSQGWDENNNVWHVLQESIVEYRYQNNKLIEYTHYYEWVDPMWYHHLAVDHYTLFYKEGENNPSKVRYDGGNYYPSYNQPIIYNDVKWNDGFQPEKLSYIESAAEYIRQDSVYYSTWHPVKMRKAYKKNGLIRKDSVFVPRQKGWVNLSSNYWNYNDDRQVISRITLGGDFAPPTDTSYMYQINYDDRGNKTLDFYTQYCGNYLDKSGYRYTYTYLDSTDLITSVTNEEYYNYADTFLLKTKEIYYKAQQHKEAKDPTPVKSFEIYPNPNYGSITISLKTEKSYDNASYQILDLNGKIIAEKQINTDYDISESIDLSELRPGLYFLVLILDNTKQYHKLIKQ